MKKLLYYFFAALLFQGCSMTKDDSTGNSTGEGGSLARFAVVGDYLYTVDESSLNTYSLVSNPGQPQYVAKSNLGFGAETIFPYGNSLLLGTQSGMYIYGLSDPSNPQQLTLFQHIRSCDPVVAENDYAFITLNASNTQCFRGLNEMQVVDIHNLSSPFLVTTYTLSSPKGLDIHNDTLFVCDDGLRIMDVSNKSAPVEISHYYDVVAEDVIYNQGRLLTIGSAGFNQYSVSSSGISKLSTIPIVP